MKTVAFFDTKPYDKVWFDRLKNEYDISFRYFDNKLNSNTAVMAGGCDGVVAFVNDTIDADTINVLHDEGIRIIALRSAGYNNVDFRAAYEKIHVVRVPAYSPYATAEHAMALLLTLNRKIHRAYYRTRDYNFSLDRLMGFDLHGKTAGVVGTGKIGQAFINICRGFGVKVLAYDLYPKEGMGFDYVSLEEIYKNADVISLHCPLTPETYHMINADTLSMMKDGVYLINTSRGALIDSEALIDAIKAKKIGGAGLDVYEEETDFFYEDLSYKLISDDVLATLVSMPNVIVTSHQGFFTEEALYNIAKVTLENLKNFFDGEVLPNEICYKCIKEGTCDKSYRERCF